MGMFAIPVLPSDPASVEAYFAKRYGHKNIHACAFDTAHLSTKPHQQHIVDCSFCPNEFINACIHAAITKKPLIITPRLVWHLLVQAVGSRDRFVRKTSPESVAGAVDAWGIQHSRLYVDMDTIHPSTTTTTSSTLFERGEAWAPQVARLARQLSFAAHPDVNMLNTKFCHRLATDDIVDALALSPCDSPVDVFDEYCGRRCKRQRADDAPSSSTATVEGLMSVSSVLFEGHHQDWDRLLDVTQTLLSSLGPRSTYLSTNTAYQNERIAWSLRYWRVLEPVLKCIRSSAQALGKGTTTHAEWATFCIVGGAPNDDNNNDGGGGLVCIGGWVNVFFPYLDSDTVENAACFHDYFEGTVFARYPPARKPGVSGATLATLHDLRVLHSQEEKRTRAERRMATIANPATWVDSIKRYPASMPSVRIPAHYFGERINLTLHAGLCCPTVTTPTGAIGVLTGWLVVPDHYRAFENVALRASQFAFRMSFIGLNKRRRIVTADEEACDWRTHCLENGEPDCPWI